MNKDERNKVIKQIKQCQRQYLDSITCSADYKQIEERFKKLTERMQSFLRKDFGSQNSLIMIPNISRKIFGLHEDLVRLRLTIYKFNEELKIINKYLIDALDKRRSSKYNGECASYGEGLLNCYLDLFVTFTVLKTPKEIGSKPSFLVNPATGAKLELDILFEDFRLAFEFQGELHYTVPSKIRKDSFKLSELPNHNRILVPVNISQLSNEILSNLIINSVKEYLGLHVALEQKDASKINTAQANKNNIINFCKLTQRIYLAQILFEETLNWLDGESSTYISSMRAGSPISSSTPAPRLSQYNGDLPINYIYKNLKYISK
ncbi:hypothetical protein [Niallia sp. BSM11]|uniref:hypothetical protein n=1 Tax=Niallia sp. BSM11 TaxID=3391576 RepID=UPI00398500DE